MDDRADRTLPTNDCQRTRPIMCADTPDTPAADYKDTLHLPQTDFPMRAGLP